MNPFKHIRCASAAYKRHLPFGQRQRPPQTRAGLLALWSQVACLTLAVFALYAPDTNITPSPSDGVGGNTSSGGRSLALFVGAVTLSRFGLYMYDVAGAQLFQYLVDEHARAVVGGACVYR